MGFPWLTFMAYSLSTMPYLYFFQNYLHPKYSNFKSYLWGICIIEFFTFLLTNYFVDRFYIKFIFVQIMLIITTLLLYKDIFAKKILSCLICEGSAQLIAIPFDFTALYILRIDVSSPQTNAALFLILAVILNTAILLFYHLYFRYLNHRLYMTKTFLPIIISVLLNFVIIVFVTSEVLAYTAIHHGNRNSSIVFIICMIFAAVLAHIYGLYSIERIRKRLKLELTIKQQEEEYEMQLQNYLENNDEAIAYILHDLMNHMRNYSE